MRCRHINYRKNGITHRNLFLPAFNQGGNEVTSEILEFIKGHHGLFARVLRDDKFGVQPEDLEELDLVTAIVSKVIYLKKQAISILGEGFKVMR